MAYLQCVRFFTSIGSVVFSLIILGGSAPVFAQVFPESWRGDWSGNCTMQGRMSASFGMALSIQPLKIDSTGKAMTFTWRIEYTHQNGRRDIRNYILERTQDPRRFKINEQNGIYLNTYCAEDICRSQFAVNTQRIVVREERVNPELIRIEMTGFGIEPLESYGQPGKPNYVETFEMFSNQKCELSLDR